MNCDFYLKRGISIFKLIRNILETYLELQTEKLKENRRINFIRKRKCYYKSKGICW